VNFICDPSLVLYLPLHELDGSSFMSRDAYGHICARTGALWRPNGHYFDGNDDKIIVAAKTWGVASAWTVSLLVKPNNTTASMRAFALNTAAYNSRIMIVLNQNANTELRVLIYDDDVDTNGFYKDYRANIITTDWQELTITYDGTNLLGFRNTSLITFSKVHDDAVTQADRSRDLGIGSVDGLDPVDGLMDEVLVYNRALTPLEIQCDYLDTKWRYR